MWVRHGSFKQEVRQLWEESTGFRGMRNLQLKLARVKKGLRAWNKLTFGNLFQNLKTAEENTIQAQKRFEEIPSSINRCANNKAIAEFILQLKMEEDFWRQKAALKWAADGDRNTKFFQGWVRQKRLKARIHEIKVGDRTITEEEEIRASAATFFQNLLSDEGVTLEEPDLDLVRTMQPDFDWGYSCESPLREEVRKAVFDMSPDSTPGPDGFSALFFQSCWDIVGEDTHAAVANFFEGGYMPRSFTSTMIVLLPKKEKPAAWSDYRPISLCNVSNKIISKVIASRLAKIVPSLISPNQSGFIRGRLLSDNVLLAQEIFQDLHKSSPSPNIAIKLDMAKAYDRVQWSFLLKVMKRMGFCQKWISLVGRCINSNWFSVLINGTAGGFFKSERGLRQGDPLSPLLFVIGAEYLSRCLDKLILGEKTLEFSTTRRSMGVSHLAYADDVIVFSKADPLSLQKINDCLHHYAVVSGQKINFEKSQYYIDEKNVEWEDRISRYSGYRRGSMPFDYLGVPIYIGAKRSAMFLFLREKISKKIHSWSHKHLSFGGRLTLIKSTLGALPIHIFQVIEPTKEALKKLESVIARYFWGSNDDKRRTHWISWEQICHPIDEGGLGVRRFKEMVEAFGIKLWWRFRDQDSLWAKFMHSKYCHRLEPARIKFVKGNSSTWRRMLKSRERAQSYIKWALGKGEVDFWDDLWFNDQPIRELCTPDLVTPRLWVKDFWRNDEWNAPMLRTILTPLGVPEEWIERIAETPFEGCGRDVLRWSLNSHGNFSTTSAWNLVRHRQQPLAFFKLFWSKEIPPSVSIFVWRLVANRVPVDEKLQWRNIHLASKCRCCKEPRSESREHLFWTGRSADKVWRFFANWFPDIPQIHSAVINLEYRILFWHSKLRNKAKRHVCLTIPCLILWFIWLERNNVIHRGSVFNTDNVIDRVIHHLHMAVSTGKLTELQWKGCRPTVTFIFPRVTKPYRIAFSVVTWKAPDPEWIKLNTDGAFRLDSALAGGGGILRDERGQIVWGFAKDFAASSSRQAEIKALLFGLKGAVERTMKIWIEVDAQEVVNLIQSDQRGSAEDRHLVVGIRKLLKNCTYKISHIHREGNSIAHRLAKQGASGSGTLEFEGQTAPAFIKAMASLERLGLPNIRHTSGDRPP